MRRSGVFTVYADELPWATGMDGKPIVGQLATGYVLLTDPDSPIPADAKYAKPRHVLEAAPGAPPPPKCVLVVADGRDKPWNPENIAKGWPEGKKHVLCAEWQETDAQTGRLVIKRGKMSKVPKNKATTSTEILPHQWAGDQ